jgi:hypothetical protein
MATRNIPVIPGVDHPDVVARAETRDEKPAGPPSGFDAIYDGMWHQLNALVCVHATFDGPEAVDTDTRLSAARALLHRTLCELHRLHSELEEWHMRGGSPEREAQP